MAADPSKGLVVFVHGRGGDTGTWGRFPELLRADAEVSRRFVIADPYEYCTNFAGMGPGIDDLAKGLADHLLLPQFQGFSSIVILAHSMGGLVARRMVLDALLAQQHTPARRILTFATPHLGSALSPRAGKQDRDLAIGSDFMVRLGRDWAAAGADRQIDVRHVVAGGDAVVGEWSATAGFRGARYHVVADADHRSLVKPPDAQAPSFHWARTFLLEHAKPGHVPAASRHYEQPLLKLPLLDRGDLSRANPYRLIYRSRAVPFFGRDDEWQHLEAFMAGADPFRWLVLQAPGGAGKSRLALELCVSQCATWYAGFLPDSERNHDWLRWQPLAPTLIVVDYATRDVAGTRALLHALASRTQPEEAYPLPCPVRVLLLIRNSDDRALRDDVIDRGDAVQALRSTGRVEDPLNLSMMADPWPIFEAV